MTMVQSSLKLCCDEELTQLYVQGDERAFNEIVERYRTRLIHFLYKIVGDVERSEDLSQEVFVRVYRHISGFDRTKKFSTWIYTVASNLAKNELRNRSRNPLVFFQTLESRRTDDDRPIDFGSDDETPDKLMERDRLRNIVNDCLEDLPPLHREVFILREVEGKEYDEIASITGTTLGTVKSRLNRARNSFMASVLMHPDW